MMWESRLDLESSDSEANVLKSVCTFSNSSPERTEGGDSVGWGADCSFKWAHLRVAPLLTFLYHGVKEMIHFF